jgi:siderophore synthetase component
MKGANQLEQGNEQDFVERALRSPLYVASCRRVIRQLLSSLIYEGAISPAALEYDAKQSQFSLRGKDAANQPVIYTCRGGYAKSFKRIYLDEDSFRRHAAGIVQEVEDIALLLYELGENLGADERLLPSFVQELEQTIFNDTLAQYYVREQSTGQNELSMYDTMERAAIDGHPYHPAYKSRIGFDLEDTLAFGPEFAPSIIPLWLAIHRDYAHISISAGIDANGFFEQELGKETYENFMQYLEDQHVAPERYTLLPVHPWQWRRQIAPLLQKHIHHREIILLGTGHDSYYPQQSIRTLANITAPMKHSLKLSLSITNTSTRRILAPHTVQNAPPISDWLHELVVHDDYLHKELRSILLKEVVGVSCVFPEYAPLGTYGIAGCIWRESLHQFLEEDEEAIPFQSMIQVASNGRPCIDAWIQRDGLLVWIKALLNTCIPPLLHLLFAHGVALEAHAQNMILIHRHGIPCRVAFKDFHDGIRFSRQLLSVPERAPHLAEISDLHARINRNSFVETDDPLLVRDFLLDAFFFINLGELAMFIRRHYQLDEAIFWSSACDAIEQYQDRFADLQERFALFDVFTPEIQVEQLTTRRLLPDTELRLHQVDNPLAQFGRIAGHKEKEK